MHYYVIHLPLEIPKELIYCSSAEIVEGARVIVNLSGRLWTGICGAKTRPEEDKDIRYKAVIEVLDTVPVLSPELMKLGYWMADYYHCSVGKALFAMLPARLLPEMEANVIWLSENVPEPFIPLKKAIDKSENPVLKTLRKELTSYPLYKRIEEGEELGLLKIERRLNHKDKPRTVNFIIRLQPTLEEDTLPLKQREAWEKIKEEEPSFPMSNISSTISYSAIKALVKKGFIKIEPRRFDPESISFENSSPLKQIAFNYAQVEAIKDITEGFGTFNVNLLYGITGSGKTEVYIELIRHYLSVNKTVIFLIPEIALTPQMVDRFQSNFGQILAIQHSQLTEKDRLIQWQKIKSGEKRIVIGARSAVFAPLPDLGLIIVDEEHEGTYKQESAPRYQGRDLAIVRAQIQNAQVILGSATPALESWYNALNGKYKLQKIESRPLDYCLPDVQVVDLRDEYEQSLISAPLLEAIDKRLQRKEQVILFQNRRGYSSFMQCLKCGKLITCKNCEISMSYHRDREEMQCHYCGNTIPSPRKCPYCGSYSFAYGAPGTQKIEQNLKILFPEAKILRMDSDSARKRDTYKSMYNRMKNKEVDILLGTQMISKGLDFPLVTLVGIVMADISLNLPDFRAAERTFQLLTQVAGRSGRRDKAGEVIIQTYNPQHYAIESASQQNYIRFATEELGYRKKLYYPPYYRLARILFQSTDLETLKKEMSNMREVLYLLRKQIPMPQLLLLGPSVAPFSKISSYYRYHLIFKAQTVKILQNAIRLFNSLYNCPSNIRKQIDIDPNTLM